MSLQDMFDRQNKNQLEKYDTNFNEMTLAEKVYFVQWNSLALAAENVELLDEWPWKPWSKNFALKFPDKQAVLGEAADIMCFLMNICLAAGATGDELEAAYFSKADVNAARQDNGYDVSVPGWKCPVCGRAIDDPSTKCKPGYCAGK